MSNHNYRSSKSSKNSAFLTALHRAKKQNKADICRFVTPVQEFFRTGFEVVDQITGGLGLPYGQMMMLRSSPGEGKSTLLLTLANSLVKKEKKNVLFISVEANQCLLANILGSAEIDGPDTGKFRHLSIGRLGEFIEVMDAFFHSAYDVAILDGLDLLSNVPEGERISTESLDASGKYAGYQGSTYKWIGACLRGKRQTFIFSIHSRKRSDCRSLLSSEVPGCSSVILRLSEIVASIEPPEKVSILLRTPLQLRSLHIIKNSYGPQDIKLPFEFEYGNPCCCNELSIKKGVRLGIIKFKSPWWNVTIKGIPEVKLRGLPELCTWITANAVLFDKVLAETEQDFLAGERIREDL